MFVKLNKGSLVINFATTKNRPRMVESIQPTQWSPTYTTLCSGGEQFNKRKALTYSIYNILFIIKLESFK